MMKIFLDFDDTLFATGRFISDFKNILKNHGVGENEFNETYREVKEKCGRFNPKEMARCLESKFAICPKESIRCIESFLDKSEGYVFSDVDEFTKAFPKESLFILTFGDKVFQKVKIEKSGLEKKVEKSIIIQKDKGEALRDFLGKREDKEIYFIDDWLEQVESVKKNFPWVTTFLMQRSEGRHKHQPNEYCDFLITDLRQAIKIIKNLEKQKKLLS